MPYNKVNVIVQKEIDHHLSTNNMRVFSEEIHRPILSFHEVQLPGSVYS